MKRIPSQSGWRKYSGQKARTRQFARKKRKSVGLCKLKAQAPGWDAAAVFNSVAFGSEHEHRLGVVSGNGRGSRGDNFIPGTPSAFVYIYERLYMGASNYARPYWIIHPRRRQRLSCFFLLLLLLRIARKKRNSSFFLLFLSFDFPRFFFLFFFFAQLRTIRPSFLSRKYSAKFPMRNHPFDSSPAGDRISIRRSCFSLFATEFGNCQGRTLFRVAGKFENTRARVSTECAVAQKFFFFFFLFRFLSQSRDTCSLVEWWEISLPCVFDTEDIFTVEYFYSPAILSFAFVNLSLGKFERYSQRPWKLYYIMWKWCSKFKISSFLRVHFVYVSANKRDKQIPICRLENVLPAREIL